MMKKLFLMSLCLLAALTASALDKLYISDFSISPGETKQVELMLDNETAFSALQADIYLPEGLTIEQENGEYLFDLTSRKGSDHTVASSMVSSGAVRIVIASQSLKVFSGNSGALVTFNITADASFSESQTIELNHVIASEANQAQHNLPDTSCTVSSYILGTNDSLYINDFGIIAGKTKQVEIMLNNELPYTALQADIYLPEGLTIEQDNGEYLFNLTSRKGSDHTITSTKLSNGAIRIVVLSQSLQEFSGNSGAIVTFNINADESFTQTGEIELKRIFTSEVNQAQHSLPNTTCTVIYEGSIGKFYINDFKIWPGQTKQVEIMLDNDLPYTALQADIYLPQSLTIEQENGEYLFELTNRKGSDHTIASTTLSNGAMRILVTSQSLQEFSGVSGALVTFNVTAASSFSEAEVIELKRIFASNDNQEQNVLPNTTCTVTLDSGIPATGITINKTSLNMLVGSAETLVATVTPSNATVKKVTWASSNTSVATVDANGNVTAVSPGATTISATTVDGTNLTASCQLTVIPATVLATGITLNKNDLSLEVGATETLVATITPSNVTNGSVTWTSSDTTVASVSSSGLVTALSAGSATITATTADGTNLTDTCQLTVNNQVITGDFDFMVDGIAYNINSDNETVTVTCTDDSDTYAHNYPGLVTAIIPLTVTHDGITYTVVGIAEHAFRNCKTLETVSIPATVSAVGTYAFGGCEALESIVVKAGNAIYDSRNSCNAIIEKSTNRLIAGCKTTVIPETVTNIGTFAFYEHHGLETIEIPSSVTVIERSAFNHILGLKRIVVPNTVVTLEPYVFSQCYGLEEVTIGSGVTSMGQGLLYGCAAVTSLTSCIMNPNTVTLGTNVFKNMDYDNCVLYVPFGSSGLYRNADQWEQFFNTVEMEGIIGDVNCDGVVTTVDITCLYNYLLNGDETYIATSDVNGDGYITTADITMIYNVMLGFEPDPSQPSNDVTTYTVNGVTFKMVQVEGGTFNMGGTDEQGSDAYDDEVPIHQVTLSSFSIGQTEVTQALWQAVMGSNPSYFTGDLQRPVERVSWNDCQTFLTKLNQMTGKNFRLLTEAEWEYAARGGKKSKTYKYAGSNTIDNVAWYNENAYHVGSSSPDYGTHAVASKQPNELGLYDMSGNVFELCQDWYGSYSSNAQTNPTGATTGTEHVYRGGSWANSARSCRVSDRNYWSSDSRINRLGLRLAQ